MSVVVWNWFRVVPIWLSGGTIVLGVISGAVPVLGVRGLLGQEIQLRKTLLYSAIGGGVIGPSLFLILLDRGFIDDMYGTTALLTPLAAIPGGIVGALLAS